MKYVSIGEKSGVSKIVLGCMRIADKPKSSVDALVHAALDRGVNMFDHADIYGGGQSESVFGEVLRAEPSLRERMILQDKCGICSGYYDLSAAHILASVEGSLRRLHTDRLDILLFHRPDVLMEPEEMAGAMRALREQGKVLRFGVSNMNPGQIRMLQTLSGEKLVADQLQLSLMHADLVTSGINVNVDNQEGVVRDGGVLEFLRENRIALEAWSPFQYGMFGGCFLNNAQYPQLNEALGRLGGQHGVSAAAIAAAWILRIPGATQVVAGSTNPAHLRDICDGADIELSREEWYELYRVCGYMLP